MPMGAWRRSAVAVVLALVLAACGGGGDAGPAPSRPSSTARLTLVEPANEATVAVGPLTVRLALEGARIVEETTTDVRPDEGHIHLTLDGRLVSMTYGLEQEVVVEEAGIHRLVAEFVAGDHAPFNPRVVAQRTFVAE